MIGPRRAWSGWLDGGHLSLDAVVALVDGELADGPAQRALAHVDHCLTCAAEVTAQRQARRRLRGAQIPGAPSSLLHSLRAIPDSAELPAAPGTLAVDHEGRLVVRADGPEHHPAAAASPPAGTAPPAGTEDGVPAPRRASRRARRRLAVGLPAAVASGLAVGAVTLAAPAAPAASPAAPTVGPRPVVLPADPGVVGAELRLGGDPAPGLPGPGER